MKEVSMSQQGFSNLTAAEFQQVFDQQVALNRRPIQVEGFSDGNQPRYNIIWSDQPGPDFVMHHNMTPADFASHNQDLTLAGFHVALESTFNVNGQTFIVAMWEK
jgi:hypothetical protein